MSTSRYLQWLLVITATIINFLQKTSAGTFDPSVCTPANVPVPFPLPALGDTYSAQIRWTSENDRRFYDVREDYDRRRGQAAVTISMPILPNDAKMIYDLNSGYISLIEDVTKPKCTVESPDSSFHTYSDFPWLASLSSLTKHIEAVKDLKFEGETDYNGIMSDKYTACLYDYATNLTLYYSLYYVGKLGTFKDSWLLPHVPLNDRSLPYAINIFARGVEEGKLTIYNVTGIVGMFNTDPIFADDAFFPPPGTWCEGLPLTSLPPLPSDFSLLAEVVDLNFAKVTYEHIYFNSQRKFVRKDWKSIGSSVTSIDLDPFTTIYDFNIGVKYKLDRHLLSCERAAPIALGDEFTSPVNGTKGLSHKFQMASSEKYFQRQGAFMQLLGQKSIRSVTCDVYIGYHFDSETERNITVQWYFSKRHWTIGTGDIIESGALLKMEVWKDVNVDPVIYNILEFRTEAPDYDVFDISQCYSAKEKIHFVLLVKVQEPAAFSSVTPRLLRDRMIEILASLVAEKNRFSGIQIDYDGGTNVYVYATLVDRSAIDNTDIAHPIQHPLNSAFDFLDGSVKSHLDFLVLNTGGKSVTITPFEILRLDFNNDFTTPAPTSPGTTLAPPMPPKLTTLMSTTTTTTTPTPTPTPTTTTTTATSTATKQCQCSPNWAQCQPVCKANNMCACSKSTSSCTPCSLSPCDCARDCKADAVPGKSNCNQVNGKSSAETTDITIAALVGGMMGTLALGLLLGFISTRIYHLIRVAPQRRLINSDDEYKY